MMPAWSSGRLLQRRQQRSGCSGMGRDIIAATGSNLAAAFLAARCPERAGENTPRHAFPPSSSCFFGNLFGNARALCARRVPDIRHRQGPSPPQWVPSPLSPPSLLKTPSRMSGQVQMVLVDPLTMISVHRFFRGSSDLDRRFGFTHNCHTCLPMYANPLILKKKNICLGIIV